MLALFILVPLLCLIVLNLPLKGMERLAVALTLALSAAQVLAVIFHPAWLWEGDSLKQWINFQFSADRLSALLLLTVGIVSFVSILVAHHTISDSRQRSNFTSVLLIALIGMNGTLLVADLFTLYVFLEVTAVASFVLIALTRGRAALEGAFKYIILSAVASILMLTAISLLLLVPKGGTSFASIHSAILDNSSNVFAKVAMAMFLCGLFIKGGLVPFHGWLPGAYSTAPASVSVLLAGIVTKVSGIYALIRLTVSVFGPNPALCQVLLLIGAISIVVGAVAALTQSDFKKVLAYSSISQMGYILLGLGCYSISTPVSEAAGLTIGQLGLIGAVFHFFNHAIFKSLLFVSSASVEKAVGTTDMAKLGGLGARMPVTSFTSVVATLSTAGVPPLSGFWSKLVIIVALYFAGYYIYAGIAIMLSVVTLAYLLVIQRRVFFGKLPQELEAVREAPAGMVLPAIILAAITVAVGVAVPFIPKALFWPLT